MSRWSLALAACTLAGCAPRRPPAAEPPPVAEDAAPEPALSRGLTEHERALVSPLFAAALDLDVIRVIQDKYVPFQGDDTYMTPENSLYAPGALYVDDFAAPGIDPYAESTFVHEMTHAWQHQSGLDLIAAGAITFASTGGDYQLAYPYVLDPDRDLTEYNVEQQASIVEDWFLVTRFGLAPWSLVQDPAAPPADLATLDTGYRAVLARFLEDPAYSRALTPDELLRRHVTAVRGKAPAAAPTP